MKNLFFRLFYRIEWNIAIREISKDKRLPLNEKKSYSIMKKYPKTWMADPFLFENNGETYLFFEKMNMVTHLGSIAYCKIQNDPEKMFGEIHEAINEPFHLSFPNVFRYGKEIYMIPESSAEKQIRLYRAVQFPGKWEYLCNLVEGIEAADTTVRVEDDMLFIMAYTEKPEQSYVYYVDMESLTTSPVKEVKVTALRPAGNSLCYDGVNYRVFQECKESYGKFIYLYKEIGNLKDGTYQDEYYGIIDSSNIDIKMKYTPSHIHTIGRTSKYEVIDYMCPRFRGFKVLYKLFNIM